MTRVEVELLTGQDNFAVIRLPVRRFPGVVFPGDSLSILEADARELAADLAQALSEILTHYASVLARHGTDLIASGWLYSEDLRAFLELTSGYIGYDFDETDWTAITTALEQDPSAGTDYPLIGSTELTARLALQDDGAHTTVAITGTPDPTLRTRLTTLLDVLTHPRTRH